MNESPTTYSHNRSGKKRIQTAWTPFLLSGPTKNMNQIRRDEYLRLTEQRGSSHLDNFQHGQNRETYKLYMT